MLTPVAPSSSNINDRLQCRRHLKAEKESGATAGTQDFDGRKGWSRQASFLAWAGVDAQIGAGGRRRCPGSRRPATVVPVEDVDLFATDYVSLFALAKQPGRHFLVAKKGLDAAGVKPALNPETVGAAFYRRADSTGK
jgi:hypothetical protein